MIKMRILKHWFFNIFDELRRTGEIDFRHPFMGQPEYGGPHRERGHLVAILVNAGIVNYHKELPVSRLTVKSNMIYNKSNDELWNYLSRKLPYGTEIITMARIKKNYIYEWMDDKVLYVSEMNFTKGS